MITEYPDEKFNEESVQKEVQKFANEFQQTASKEIAASLMSGVNALLFRLPDEK